MFSTSVQFGLDCLAQSAVSLFSLKEVQNNCDLLAFTFYNFKL